MSEVFHRTHIDLSQEGISREFSRLMEECEIDSDYFKDKKVALLRNVGEGKSVLYDQVVASAMRSIRVMGGHVSVLEPYTEDEEGVIKPIPDGTIVKETSLHPMIANSDVIYTISYILVDSLYGFTGATVNAALQGNGRSSVETIKNLPDEERPIGIAEIAAAVMRNHDRFHIAVSEDIYSNGQIMFRGLGLMAAYDMVAMDELIGNLLNEQNLDEIHVSEHVKANIEESSKDWFKLAESLARPVDNIQKVAPCSHWQAMLRRVDNMNVGTRSYAHVKDGIMQRG